MIVANYVMNSNPSPEDRFQEVLQGIVTQWLLETDEQEEVSRRILSAGGIQVVKSALHSPEPADEFLALWARDRPDLTFEALALCPAWNDLFSEDEREIARARLSEFRVKWETRPERRAKTWRDTWTFWIDGRPVGANRHGREDLESESPTCEMFARAAQTFNLTCQFGASFSQRRHFRSCHSCSSIVDLDEIITALDEEEFRRLLILVRALTVCSALPLESASWYVGSSDQSWRAILLSCHVAESCNIRTDDWVAARDGHADQAFNRFVQGLDKTEFFTVPLSNRVASVIGYGVDDANYGISLPTDGDLSSEPGVLNAVHMTGDWTDLLGEWPDLPPPNNGADVFQGHQFLAVAAAAAENDINLARTTSTPALTPISRRVWIAEESPESLPNRETPSTMTDTASRERAESSLRTALGPDIYNSLCPDALFNAVEAQYRSFDRNAPMGNVIVAHLATAFEQQLKERVIRPFLDELKHQNKLFDFRWPWDRPKAVERLTLGMIETLLRSAQPELVDFLHIISIDIERLVSCLPQIKDIRNDATHGARVFPYDEACRIRDRWLGIDGGIESDGGIFGVFSPYRSPS